jgi:hypothetical protein
MTIFKKTTLLAALLAGSTLSPLPLLAQDASGNQKLIPPTQAEKDSQSKKGTAAADDSAQMKQPSGSTETGAKADAQIKPSADQSSGNTASSSDQKTPRDQAQSDPMKKPGSTDAKSGQSNTANQNDPKMKSSGDTAATQKQQPDGQSNQNSAASQSIQPSGKDQQSAQGSGQSGTSDMNKSNTAQGTATQTNEGNSTDSASTNRPSNEITGSINISTEQKTEIRDVIVENKVETVKPTFSVSVGVAVPKTVKLHRLPPRVVEILPQYKSYEYFVLADNRIVIVEPSTYEIVYILVV